MTRIFRKKYLARELVIPNMEGARIYGSLYQRFDAYSRWELITRLELTMPLAYGYTLGGDGTALQFLSPPLRDCGRSMFDG